MTKNQRKEIYWAAMFYLMDAQFCGLCSTLDSIETQYNLPISEHISEYLELYAQKPTHVGLYWWNPYERNRRLKALSKAIDLCESKNK